MSDTEPPTDSSSDTRVALRVRAREHLVRLCLSVLAWAGKPLSPVYRAIAEAFVSNEVDRIKQLEIGTSSFYGLLRLYPDLQRTFFVHIPKCGGTSIRQSLVDEYGCAPVPLPGPGATRQAIDFMVGSVPPETPQGDLLAACTADIEQGLSPAMLRVFTAYRLVRSPRRAFILGHKITREILPFYRADKDTIFTTVRDPAEALKSMVAYRVSHTLGNRNRIDSVEFLSALQMGYAEFERLATADPRSLTERALTSESLSLANFLASAEDTDCESVWQGIKKNNIFIAHMSEQSDMLTQLFAKRPVSRHKNRSEHRHGAAAEFSNALQEQWIEPFVDPESRALYRTFVSAGIPGFWKNGGSVEEYLKLIEKV